MRSPDDKAKGGSSGDANPGASRKDPYMAFNFVVEIEGLTVGGFSEVSGLQIETETGWHNVARWSVAHANFHVYQWSWRGGRHVRHEYGPLEEVADIARAYQQAVRDAYPQVETLIGDWRKEL